MDVFPIGHNLKCCGLSKRNTKWSQAKQIYWRSFSQPEQPGLINLSWSLTNQQWFLLVIGVQDGSLGDMVTVQQNERSYEEGERKGERGSNTLCQHRKSHREKAKRRDWGHRVKYISSRRCIYLNVRKRRSLLISVKRKWQKTGQWVEKWKGLSWKQGGKIQGLMLEKLGHAAQRHCTKAKERLIHMTTDSPAFMLTRFQRTDRCTMSGRF